MGRMVDMTAWRRCTVVAYLDEPPFSVPTAVGPPVGCDVEVAGEVLGLLGVERVEFVLTNFGELIPGVVARRWHMNAPIFITDQRATAVRYSLPVWAACDGLSCARTMGVTSRATAPSPATTPSVSQW